MAQASKIATTVKELTVIVVGVLIALAADNWRSGLEEASIERQYLVALADDLAAGQRALAGQRSRFTDSRDAAANLADILDSDGAATREELERLLLTAYRVGWTRRQFGPDATYRELMASGRLSLLEDARLRAMLVAYGGQIEALVTALQDVDAVEWSIAEMTGYLPFMFLGSEERLEADDHRRIAEYLNRPNLPTQLRRLHGQVDMLLRYIDRTIEDNAALQAHIAAN